jgi:C1A family cysteine protease
VEAGIKNKMDANFSPKLDGFKPGAGLEILPEEKLPSDISYSLDKLRVGSSNGQQQPLILEKNGILDLRKYCSPVEDQYLISSCAPNSTVGALEFLEIRNGIKYTDLSRMFIYYNARLMEGKELEDCGSYIRLAFGTLASIGVCTEEIWPYDTSAVYQRPSWKAYRDAYAHKIDAFYQIDDFDADRDEKIKEALRSNHAVVFGMMIDQDYIQTGFDGVISMPKKIRPRPGMHAQLIVGYTRQYWILKNSWSSSWADGGYCYVPFAYLNESMASDFWVATKAV